MCTNVIKLVAKKENHIIWPLRWLVHILIAFVVTVVDGVRVSVQDIHPGATELRTNEWNI